MSEERERPQPDAPRRPKGRGLKIALAVSVAFNLLVLGLVGGALLNRPGADEAPTIRALGLGPYAWVLPREGRAEVRERIEADLPSVRRNRAEIGRSLLVMRRALLSEPFNREAAERALAASRRAATALQVQGHAALLDTLEQMSAADRAVVAERLGRTLRRMADRRGGGANN